MELTDAGRLLAERTESNREVLSIFFREILGVKDEVANEDACMIEHLVSPEAMAQLLRLITALRSENEVAKRFRETFQGHLGEGCADDAGECEICRGNDCLIERYESQAGETA